MTLKSQREIAFMRKAGQITRGALKAAEAMVRPGVTTREIDKAAEDYILSQGGIPSCKGFEGYPCATCISINDQVVHGIPGDRVLKEGDIVSVDICAGIDGYHGDAARTFPVGRISPDAERLIQVTRQSFYEGLKYAKLGYRIGDIAGAVQDYVESNGYSVVRALTGHGIGKSIHEAPEVPNFRSIGKGLRLLEGMTIAVEPMVNAGTYKVNFLPDGWTVVTADGALSAHYENTIAITNGEPEILTVL